MKAHSFLLSINCGKEAMGNKNQSPLSSKLLRSPPPTSSQLLFPLFWHKQRGACCLPSDMSGSWFATDAEAGQTTAVFSNISCCGGHLRWADYLSGDSLAFSIFLVFYRFWLYRIDTTKSLLLFTEFHLNSAVTNLHSLSPRCWSPFCDISDKMHHCFFNCG